MICEGNREPGIGAANIETGFGVLPILLQGHPPAGQSLDHGAAACVGRQHIFKVDSERLVSVEQLVYVAYVSVIICADISLEDRMGEPRMDPIPVTDRVEGRRRRNVDGDRKTVV